MHTTVINFFNIPRGGENSRVLLFKKEGNVTEQNLHLLDVTRCERLAPSTAADPRKQNATVT